MFPRKIAVLVPVLAALVTAAPVTVIVPANGSFSEKMAAKELRRYMYLRTGSLPQIVAETSPANVVSDAIIAVNKSQPIIQSAIGDAAIKNAIAALGPQQYYITTITAAGRRAIWIAGGDETAVLYGTYAYCEKMGVGFYLEGDVLPDSLLATIPDDSETGKPLFDLRGILPFHDFPEGPDWWNREEYKTIMAQLVKLRMNFFGLHTYPWSNPFAELTTWIGQASDVKTDGTVSYSYPASFRSNVRISDAANGCRDDNNYKAKTTGTYNYGASQVFDRDTVGADVQAGVFPLPLSGVASNTAFNNTGLLFKNSFTYAHKLGIKTCVGTKVPVEVPPMVATRVGSTGLAGKIYEGIFTRIMRAYPIDYYWLWTPEEWLYGTAFQLTATDNDILTAYNSLKKIGAPFKLATAGWMLGPDTARGHFDKVLPKDIAVSAADGWCGDWPVDSAFGKMTGREKWAISWLEDDRILTLPQFWTKRCARDAADALKYGCNGLIGLHWATRKIGPTVSAQAHLSWNLTGWNSLKFYRDWAQTNFGAAVADSVAAIFNSFDGNFPASEAWAGGPGDIIGNPSGNYTFVGRFEKLRAQVKGRGSLDRFDYWLAQLRFARATAFCKNGQISDSVPSLWKNLLATVSTTGELGAIMNLENKDFPALKNTMQTYAGTPRIFTVTPRPALEKGENLTMKAIVLASTTPAAVTLYWRPLGSSNPFTQATCPHVNRGVFQVSLAGSAITGDFEYYLKTTVGTTDLYFPASAPQICQTVVIDGLDPVGVAAPQPQLTSVNQFLVKSLRINGVPSIIIHGMGKTPCAVRLFDSRGKIVSARSLKNGEGAAVQIRGIGTGVYLVQVTSDFATKTTALILSR